MTNRLTVSRQATLYELEYSSSSTGTGGPSQYSLYVAS